MKLKFSLILLSAALAGTAMAENATIAEGEYFIRNVSTGRYLTCGYSWGTHAALKDQARAFQVTPKGEGYVITSSLGYLKLDGELYMDGTEELVANVTKDGDYVNIAVNGKYLQTGEHIDYTTDWLAEKVSCEKDMENVAVVDEADKDAVKAQWEFVTRETLVSDLAKATADKPLEASFLIKAHNLDVNDKDNDVVWKYTKNGKEDKIILPPGDWGHPMNEWMNKATYAWCQNDDLTADCEDVAWQDAEGLPEGGYRVTYRVVNQSNTPLSIDFNGVKAEPALWEETDLWYASAAETLAANEKTAEFNVEADGKLTIKMTKSCKVGEQNRFAFKSFKLQYLKDKVAGAEGVEKVDAAIAENVDVYTISGVKVAAGVNAKALRNILDKGLYIITDGKTTEKVAL